MASPKRVSSRSGVHLLKVDLKEDARRRTGHPFELALVRRWEAVDLAVPVTFLVGENATGKSTFLEAVAVAAGSIAVGQADLGRDPTLAAARALSEVMRLSWRVRTRTGFFLRAEDFFAFVKGLHSLRAELAAMAEGYDRELEGYGRQLARGAVLGQSAEVDRTYGGDLDERSHGESFLTLFQSRLRPGGLYLLDEPEAALSPTSQLALLALLKDYTARDAQFVIATHSPLLMAFPGARILSFDAYPVRAIAYDDVPHVRLWRDFMRYPDLFLAQL